MRAAPQGLQHRLMRAAQQGLQHRMRRAARQVLKHRMLRAARQISVATILLVACQAHGIAVGICARTTVRTMAARGMGSALMSERFPRIEPKKRSRRGKDSEAKYWARQSEKRTMLAYFIVCCLFCFCAEINGGATEDTTQDNTEDNTETEAPDKAQPVQQTTTEHNHQGGHQTESYCDIPNPHSSQSIIPIRRILKILIRKLKSLIRAHES